MANLIASNQSAVFIQTQAALGTFVDASATATNAIRVVGTPTWSVRGAGIIDRKEVYTPWGGNSASRTGGLGWDITFQTEFFWEFGQAYDVTLANQTQLAALWLSSPWRITHPTLATRLEVQPFFYPSPTRSPVTAAVQPFSMVYEETGGKRYEAFDCVALPKISWEYGQRVMIDWTIKGSWRPVTNSLDSDATYVSSATQAPVIGVNCSATILGLTCQVDALSKVTIDTGWTLNDVGNSLTVDGFGISFFRQDSSPSLELEMAEFNETFQASWLESIGNTIGSSIDIVLNVGATSWTISLYNPQYVSVPSFGETNGYRSTTLKWQSIPDSSAAPLTFLMTTSN